MTRPTRRRIAQGSIHSQSLIRPGCQHFPTVARLSRPFIGKLFPSCSLLLQWSPAFHCNPSVLSTDLLPAEPASLLAYKGFFWVSVAQITQPCYVMTGDWDWGGDPGPVRAWLAG